MIAIIDNYDSFTYNLFQYFSKLTKQKIIVYKNDEITVNQLFLTKNLTSIIISPGPCSPNEAGISCAVIKKTKELRIPLLGICLGMQALAQVFGAKIIQTSFLMHGKISKIEHYQTDIFKDIPSPFNAVRYHSLAIENTSIFNTDIKITAKTDNNIIMAIKHNSLPLYGVQFHPESILTDFGYKILKNFLDIARSI